MNGDDKDIIITLIPHQPLNPEMFDLRPVIDVLPKECPEPGCDATPISSVLAFQ
jgi:hypothetical protein